MSSVLSSSLITGGRAARLSRGAGRNPALAVSIMYLMLLVVGAAIAPLLPYGPYVPDVMIRNAPPSLTHWLGTDEIGRDLFARLVYGARVSLVVAVTSSLIAVAIGILVGTIAGYVGGRTDSVIMRFVDSMYAFPDTLFAILIAALVKGQLGGQVTGILAPLAEAYRLSGGLLGVLLTLGLTCWLTTSRLVRSQILSLKNAEYVLAARLAGGSGWFIVRKHLLPNSVAPILVAITFVVPNAILLEAGLSFLGVGVDPPTPSWGTMIASGVQSIQSCPHLLVAPAFTIGATLLALNVVGDALRDFLDPALRESTRA